MKTYLICFCSLQPKKWSLWFPWAEWSYNTAYHTATKMSPYEVVYGQPPPSLHVYEAGTTKLDMVDQSLLERGKMISLLKANLEATQVCMTAQANKHRTERIFQVGDMVYLQLVPYQQMSLASQPFHKL